MSSPVTTAALQKSEGLHPTKGSTFVLLEDPATPRTVTKQELTDHLVDTMGLHPARVHRQREVGGIIYKDAGMTGCCGTRWAQPS